MKRTIRSAIMIAALPVLGTSMLAACGSTSHSSSPATTAGGASPAPTSSSASAGSLTIGSADFTESALLADIYGDALKAKGVSITKKLDIGERAVYWKAMQDGSINFIPEYNGSILYYLSPSATAKSTAAVTAALPAALGSQFEALNPAPAQDSDTITVTKATAQKYNLTSIADLVPIASAPHVRSSCSVPDPPGRHPGAEERLRRHLRHVHCAVG